MSLAGASVVIVGDDREQSGISPSATNSGATFPRSRRLLRPTEFSSVLAAPVIVRAGEFAMHAAARTAPGWRLGLVIPKRFVASAARRNAIKRRWREAFRLRAASLDAQFGACDLVVRMTARRSESKRVMSKQAATTLTKSRKVRRGIAIQAIDAIRMIDQMVARLSSKAPARYNAASLPR